MPNDSFCLLVLGLCLATPVVRAQILQVRMTLTMQRQFAQETLNFIQSLGRIDNHLCHFDHCQFPENQDLCLGSLCIPDTE